MKHTIWIVPAVAFIVMGILIGVVLTADVNNGERKHVRDRLLTLEERNYADIPRLYFENCSVSIFTGEGELILEVDDGKQD